ncbi:MAG TPA: hypothetical protein VEJ20_08790, partial [Candidatus Eremiobacteraceae bacterium]|nr:hypothetical protein [Candidatus Eremiobacteraceae bacterium]
MATSGSGHVTARTVFVLGLALSILSISTFNLKRIWQPIGVYGYGTNIDGVVTGVDPGSPAARAGIGVGDRLDETKMTPKELEELIQLPQVASPGITRTFDVLRGDTRRTVSITSEPEPMGASDVTGLVATWIGGLLFIGIGAAIVLLRPEPATWGFYLFCVGYAPADWTALYVTSGAPAIQIEQIIQGLVNAAAVVGLIAFSLYFLHPILGGWRRIVLGCLPVIYLAVVAVYTDEVVNTYLLARPAEAAAHLGIALNVLCSIIVVVALTDTLVRR